MDFRDVVSDFWDRGAGSETFAPLTAGDIERVQESLGVTLPSEYLTLLRDQNGGYVSAGFNAFPTSSPTSWAVDHVPLRTLSGIGPDDAFGSITESPNLCREWDMPEDLVLLSGEGHYWIALDYRRIDGRDEPSVAWIDNEVGQDLQLAPSFADFVESLQPMKALE